MSEDNALIQSFLKDKIASPEEGIRIIKEKLHLDFMIVNNNDEVSIKEGKIFMCMFGKRLEEIEVSYVVATGEGVTINMAVQDAIRVLSRDMHMIDLKELKEA